MTLMPVSSIWVRGSSSSNGGGSRWIGQYVSASTASTSRGSPRTLNTWPSVAGPTGIFMEAPVFRTGEPRTTPSVGRMATARTMLSPTCSATSQVIDEVSPPSVRSTTRAVSISGIPSGGNSASITGPITRTTRPSGNAPLPLPLSAIRSSAPRRRLLERFGSADDLHDLLGDLGLAGLVGLPGQDLDQLVRVV